MAQRDGKRLRVLDRRAREAFLLLALPEGALRKACRKLGLGFPGYRLESIPGGELARALAEEYERDPRVAALTESLLQNECQLRLAIPARSLTPDLVSFLVEVAGAPPSAVAPVLWGLFGHRAAGVRKAAATALEGYLDHLLEDFAIDADGGEGRDGGAGRAADQGAATRGDLHRRLREAESRARGLARGIEEARGQLTSERRLSADKDTRVAQMKAELEVARDRLRQLEDLLASRAAAKDQDLLKEARLKASETERLTRERDDLQERLKDAHLREAELKTLLRTREMPVSIPPAAPARPQPAPGAPPFLVPVFTQEFYESLPRWDPRVARTAFDKVLLLCQNLAHPGIDAKAIQGADGLYRIFVAQDVRLFYRRPHGGRIEILGLIDRENLDRYIRQYKSRTGA